MEKTSYWTYIAFSYIIPCGLLFYTFVIENLMNEEIGIWTKLGAVGIFALAICLIICILVINKLFSKVEKKYEKLSIKEIDTTKRAEYILKWNKAERNHNIFKQGLMLGVFIVLTMLVALLESKLLALRGTMTTITISYAIGFACFVWNENIKLKKVGNSENKGTD